MLRRKRRSQLRQRRVIRVRLKKKIRSCRTARRSQTESCLKCVCSWIVHRVDPRKVEASEERVGIRETMIDAVDNRLRITDRLERLLRRSANQSLTRRRSELRGSESVDHRYRLRAELEFGRGKEEGAVFGNRSAE